MASEKIMGLLRKLQDLTVFVSMALLNINTREITTAALITSILLQASPRGFTVRFCRSYCIPKEQGITGDSFSRELLVRINHNLNFFTRSSLWWGDIERFQMIFRLVAALLVPKELKKLLLM